jgi:hypothetical protein
VPRRWSSASDRSDRLRSTRWVRQRQDAVGFFAFGTSHVSFIQLFGLGTGLAILIDATLVRGVFVPAFVRVFGERSWYAPARLRRIHNRIGVSENPSDKRTLVNV